MLKITENLVKLTRGDTGTLKLAVKDAQDNDYDFSSDTVVFTVKRYLTDAEPVISKKFDSDGQIAFEADDTKNLEFGDYWYDVQITTESGDVCTVIEPSTFRIAPEVS